MNFVNKGWFLPYNYEHRFNSSSDILDEHGVRLNVIGRKELLPVAVQRAVLKAEGMTRTNTRYGFLEDNVETRNLTSGYQICIKFFCAIHSSR